MTPFEKGNVGTFVTSEDGLLDVVGLEDEPFEDVEFEDVEFEDVEFEDVVFEDVVFEDITLEVVSSVESVSEESNEEGSSPFTDGVQEHTDNSINVTTIIHKTRQRI